MRDDQHQHQLLADVLMAMLTRQHDFPPDLVGRVVMAVGPCLFTAIMADAEPYYPAHTPQPQPAYAGITSGQGSWG